MSGTQEAVVLRLSRRFNAPRERVFEAWTNEDVLRKWWAAQPSWDTPVAEVDARPGGSYRLAMRDPESGETHTLVGEYREVTPPERLVYTWTWESNVDAMSGSENTLVEVDFREDGDATEVVVTHSGFATPELRDMHTHGWNGCLDNLERRVFGG
jgi:uncharacterized protein YndB with AHSA1/START domain